MRLYEKIKACWNSFLKRLIESNHRTYGNQRIACRSHNSKTVVEEPSESPANESNRL